MPIYEYYCKDCGEQFEKMTSMAKADEMECQECGSTNTERLLSLFGVGASQPKSPCAGGACPPQSPCAAHGPGPGCGGCPGLAGM